MNRRLTVAVAATAALGLPALALASTAGAAAKKNEIRIVGGTHVQGRQVRQGRRALQAGDKTVKSGSTVKVRRQGHDPAAAHDLVRREAVPAQGLRVRRGRSRSLPRTPSNEETEERRLLPGQRRRRRPERPAGVLEVDSSATTTTAGRLRSSSRPTRARPFKVTAHEGLHALLLLRDPPLDAGQDQGQLATRCDRSRPCGGAGATFARGLAAIVLPALAARARPLSRLRRVAARVGRRRAKRRGTPCPTRATRSTARASTRPRRRSRRSSTAATRAAGSSRCGSPTRPAPPRRFNGPLIRARVGDELRIHFKNMDTLHDNAHSMHFHGVEYKPSSDGVWLPLFSGKGGNVKPGQSFTYQLTAGPGSAGFWPYHDHSIAMEESIAGGMFGGLSIAGRHERRSDREFVVAFAPWHGFQTINGRAFVGNTPVYQARVGESRPVERDGDGRRVPYVPRARAQLAHRRRHAGGHARARARPSRSGCAGARTRRARGSTTATSRPTWRRG